MNDVLCAQARGDYAAEEIRTMVSHWVFADRVRLTILFVGFLGLLRALSIPFPAAEVS